MKRWIRKLLGIVLCAAMVIGLVPGVMPAVKATLSGSGTETDPYLISTADELLEFRDIVNGKHASISRNRYACAKLIGDIEMDGIAWTEIDTFYGTFDGQNHKIENLNGFLVSWVGNTTNLNSVIKQVVMEGGSASEVGRIACRNYGTIQDCSNTGSVSGEGNIGGIVGHNYGSIINCTNSGTVSGLYSCIGGILGQNLRGGTVSGCSNSGTVKGTTGVGGISGRNYGTISDCSNTAAVSGNDHIGGVAGGNYNKIQNSTNTGTVTGVSYFGSIAGTTDGDIIYSVTLHVNGGTINSGDVTEYTVGTGATLPTDVTKDGFVFGGWYANENLSGSKVTSISTTETGDKEYWAKWNCSVTLNTNGGTFFPQSANVRTYTPGSSKSLPDADKISQLGYLFGGWFDNEALTGTAVTEIAATETGAKEYWAKWYQEIIPAVSNADHGSVTVDGSGVKGTTMTLTAVPTDGYGFVRWTENGRPVITDNPYSFTVAATGQATRRIITAVFKNLITHTVTFKVVNGAWDDQTTDDKEKVFTYPDDEDYAPRLLNSDIPLVGNSPAPGFEASGTWMEGTEPVALPPDIAIRSDHTYTYVYTEKPKISATATFKVVNGAWDNGETEDITVTVNGHEGDPLMLTADQIPAVGSNPAEGHGAGTWDVAPDTAVFTKDTTSTFTYTYGEKTSAVVTVKPAANSLVYSGAAQALVSAGAAEGGTMQYALGTDGTTVPADGWSTSVPAKTEVGTYYVWYKAVGDACHFDSAAGCVQAIIEENPEELDKAAADAVTELINSLTDNSTKEEVETARKRYDDLTENQKKYVSAETVAKLENAEKAIAEAEKKPVPGTYEESNGVYTVTDAGIAIYVKPVKPSSKLKVLDTVNVPTVGGSRTDVPVKEIRDKAFSSAKKKMTQLTIGRNVEIIGKSACEKCANLSKVIGGAAVREIRDKAFASCTKLKKIPAFSNLVKIGKSAFTKVKGLTKFVFGKFVSNIGAKAFFECGSLKTLTFNGTGKLSVANNAFGKIAPDAKATIKKQVKNEYTKQLKKGKLKESQIKAK